MSEYIDKNELLTTIGEKNGRMPLWLDEILMECKAADVAPVVHGSWILERDPAGKAVCYHCSACDSDGCHTSVRIAYKYCPNCGAKMGGGGKT